MRDIKRLNEAFNTFTLASERLRDYYQSLQAHVEHLTVELQKKNAELQQALGFLNSVIHCIREAIIVLDRDERIIMMNRSAERILGTTLADSRGRRAVDSGCGFTTDGEEVELDTGSGRRRFFVSISEVNNDEEGLIGYVILLSDVTLLKEMEAERIRNRRLIAMGEMMANIVHELRNPLCSIELYSSMLYKELENSPHASLARGVSTGVRNLNNFLSNMLYFARPRNPRPGRCNVRELVDEALTLVEPVAGSRGIGIERTVADSVINGDPGLLKQVLLNLLLNAVQSMDAGGTLTVSTEREGGGLRLSVSDTGCGISEEDLDKIFDPFFTTRDEGTGLGLPISLRIMQAHGGTIKVRSVKGSGSTFILSFPEEAILKEVNDAEYSCC